MKPPEQPHSPQRLVLLHRLLFFAPFFAGASLGVFVNDALRFPDLTDRLWFGARLDLQTLPSPASIVLLFALAATALWFVLSQLLKGSRSLSASLRLHAVPFLPSLSLLVLFAVDRYEIVPALMLLSVHALVLSVAGFLAIETAILASREKPPLPRLTGTLDRRALWFVAALALLYCLTFSALGILQYNAMNISYTDTADWEQMLHNTLHGRFLQTTAFPHMFFGEHVQFIHLLLLPLYALFPSLKTLMILKSAALASGAFPVYLLARRTSSSRLAALLLAAAYLLYAPMQYVYLELVYNTFRPVAFAIPALLWAVYFLDRDNIPGLAVASFFAVAAKEEMALPIAMIGLLLLLRRRWVTGSAFFLSSVAWFFASVLFVIPHFRGGPTHMTNYYLDFGQHQSFASLIAYILSHPFHTLSVAFRFPKVDYLLLLLVPLGLRPLFSWRMLFIMLPSLATTLLASRNPSYSIGFHYQASLVPFMIAGAVYGSAACTDMLPRLGFFFPSASSENRRRAALSAMAVLVFASALFSNVIFAPSPNSLIFHNPRMETFWKTRYLSTERSRLFFAEVAPLIPPDASVSATEFAATHFARREDDYVFPLGLSEADYVVIDTRDRWLAGSLAEKSLSLPALLADPRYAPLYDREGFIVMRRLPPPAPSF